MAITEHLGIIPIHILTTLVKYLASKCLHFSILNIALKP